MVCVAQVRALSPEVWCVVKTSLKRIMIKVIQGEYPARTKTNHRITGILSIWTWPCFGQGWCFKPHNSLQNISDSPSKRVNRFLIELLFSFQAWRCTNPYFQRVWGTVGWSWVESASAKLAMGLWPVRSRDKVSERISSIESNQDLGGGFKRFFMFTFTCGNDPIW